MHPSALLLLVCGWVCAAEAAVEVVATWNITGADAATLHRPTLEAGLRTLFDNAGVPYDGYSLNSLSGSLAPAPPYTLTPAPSPRPPPPAEPSPSSAPDQAMVVVVSLLAVGVTILAVAFFCYTPPPPRRRPPPRHLRPLPGY